MRDYYNRIILPAAIKLGLELAGRDEQALKLTIYEAIDNLDYWAAYEDHKELTKQLCDYYRKMTGKVLIKYQPSDHVVVGSPF